MKKLFILLLGIMLFYSCEPVGPGNWGQQYIPVYSTVAYIENIGVETPKATEKPGKIYVQGSLLLQNDLNQGIHFINIADRKHPKKISFLRIPFSTEISVKGRYLYANNFNDLLVFDIYDHANPVLVKRLRNVFPYNYKSYPPANGSFECVDPSKGIVVDWVLGTVENAKCRR